MFNAKKEEKRMPVYFINGFLESGKTEFISFTLSQPYFQSRGKTLLIVCEEGEIDYDARLLKETRTFMEILEREEDFCAARLEGLEQKYRPGRVIVEYNGMWPMKGLRMPAHWRIEQQITCIDAGSFPVYYTNMRSMVAEMIRASEMILFNRCSESQELAAFKRNVKAVNQQAEIVFEGKDGEINETLEEELPYDLNQPVIELDTMGFGVWYLDALDHLERYEGKTLRFTAQVLKPAGFAPGFFVPGRLAMTCCADDMAFLGFPCAWKGARELKNKAWIEITARMGKRRLPEYEGEGPFLEALRVEKAEAPADPVINFM